MRPNSLGRFGIVITYLGIIALVPISLIAFLGGYVDLISIYIFGGSLVYSLILLFLTIRYDSGFSNNYILVGILALFFTFLGGLFILIGVKEIDNNFLVNSNETYKNKPNNLEYITYTRPSILGKIGIIITYLGMIALGIRILIELIMTLMFYGIEITVISIFAGWLTYSLILLFLTTRYAYGHTNKFKLAGILALFPTFFGGLFILIGVKKISIYNFYEIIDQLINSKKIYQQALISQGTLKKLISNSMKKLKKLEKEFFKNKKISLSEKLLLLEKLNILVTQGIIEKEELIKVSNDYL